MRSPPDSCSLRCVAAATQAEREDWRVIGRGERIHRPRIDEDLSVAGLLAVG